jgi:hypothetical protein
MSQLSPTSSNSQHKQDCRTKHKNYQTIDQAGGKDTYDALRKNLRGSITRKDTYKVAELKETAQVLPTNKNYVGEEVYVDFSQLA